MKLSLNFDTGFKLTVDLLDNNFVERWTRLLRLELNCGSLLQEDTFSSFLPESVARQRLESAIGEVNNFLNREFIKKPTEQDYEDRNFYNHLHEQFERLAGPDWSNPTRLMLIAPENVKLAIKHINRYCHRLEQRPYRSHGYMRVEFNTSQREELKESDYLLFENITEPNMVLLDYSTLGKSLFECFDDGLDANYHGVKIQKHYCANFILQFRPPRYNTVAFEKWCRTQGIRDIPVTELKHLPLGRIQSLNSLEEIKKTIKIVSIDLE